MPRGLSAPAAPAVRPIAGRPRALRQVTLSGPLAGGSVRCVTTTEILSWAIPVIGGIGTYLARDYRVGWAIGLATQGLWIILGMITGLPGLAVSALWFGAIQFRNWRTFTPRARHRRRGGSCACGT